MAAAASKAPPGENITSLLSKDKSYCLNESPAHPWRNLLAGGGAALSLRSDADEQLLLSLALNQTVKLTAITFGLPTNDSCPRTVRLFCNVESIGFDEASARPATQEFTIPDSSSDNFVFTLAAVKWQRTDSISIFVVDNHGSDVSSLTSVNLYGTTTAGTDVSQIKKG